jgi:tetratricopeptide (TPR) repeat protein
VDITLNTLAILYLDTQRKKDAEAAYLEALPLYRELAKSDPDAYQHYVADTLSNLANLYSDTQRMRESAVVLEEALHIFQELAIKNPSYEPRVTAIKNALAAIAVLTDGERTK